MSGRLVLTTPWSRQYFRDEHRADVEALIPDGHVLTVGAQHKPGVWTLRLVRDRVVVHDARVYARDLAFACAETLRRWAREDAMTVTVDLEGTPTLVGWDRG